MTLRPPGPLRPHPGHQPDGPGLAARAKEEALSRNGPDGILDFRNRSG